MSLLYEENLGHSEKVDPRYSKKLLSFPVYSIKALYLKITQKVCCTARQQEDLM
ncbi:hypothetical protein IFO66_15780 [Paenibacillus sp. CAU 1523]|uniref:Uncharacterized protein n=1 Tax=Paenibacillus arenosi TaxID=2774142 RepID=A0ABR9B030_9BACL|nr:hypothetical protein [Paenibacillus arenosi]